MSELLENRTELEAAMPHLPPQNGVMNKGLNKDILTVLTAKKPDGKTRLAKRWTSLSEEPEPYGGAKWYTQRQVAVGGIDELHAVLEKLRPQSNSCVIRGDYIGDEKAAEVNDPDRIPNLILRRGSFFDDKPHHWLMFDVDGYENGNFDPLTRSEDAFTEWVDTVLPECFTEISFVWHLSGRAGHPLTTGLRGHVWFWLRDPIDSWSLKNWARTLPVDRSVFNTVQAHYTADPIMAPGIQDPVMARMGLFKGLFASDVVLKFEGGAELGGEADQASRPGLLPGRDNYKDPRTIPGIVGHSAECLVFQTCSQPIGLKVILNRCEVSAGPGLKEEEQQKVSVSKRSK